MVPVVIAHRGASGYLPEHTLAAKGLAHEMGADYLEQDVVASRDDELVVLHDIQLDRVTDVAERFPNRARDDGRFYARDFDLGELSTLSVWERLDEHGQPVYPDRYPPRDGDFRLHTLAEEIEFIHRLNERAGRRVGIYPEIKRPAWHREEGIDVALRMLEILENAGYSSHDDPVYVQCFDAAELRRVRHELGCPLKLVQLIGENDWDESDTDYVCLRTDAGISEVARTVDAIGPWLPHIYELQQIDATPVSTGLVTQAHTNGLAVHPYTFRVDDLPAGFSDFTELVRYCVDDLGVDGLFTDFPDQALAEINRE